MSNNFDVIIIGAGPGGLNCAKTLEKSNLRVLLIEKNKVIGPKVCAGGITTKDLAYLHIPEDIIDYSYNKFIVETPKIKTHFSYPKIITCTIDRPKFGAWQASQLQKTKITIGQRVVKISPKSIELENGQQYFYKFLVGADGSNSIVRRYLKIKTSEMITGIQYIIPKKRYDSDELVLRFSNREFSFSYGWIFPHKDFVSIGTAGVPGKFDILKLKRNLEHWIQNLGISLEDAKFESHPLNVDYQGHDFGNIFLIGDAAGLISPFTGEGIYSAMVSGEDIAQKIINPDHKTEKIAKLVTALGYHRKVLRTIEKAGVFRQVAFNKIVKKFRQPEFVELAVEKFL